MLNLHCITHRPVNLANTGISILQVGNDKENFGDSRDSDGCNIASRNSRFSELTGFYQVWKNQPSPLVGFCHYRRFLIPTAMGSWLRATATRPYQSTTDTGVANYASGYLMEHDCLQQKIAQADYSDMFEQQLDGADILLPKSNVLPAGGFLQQYGNAHPVQYFFELLALMAARDNALARDAHRFFTQVSSAHWNNLFVTRWDLYCDYCDFAFDLLLALDDRLPSIEDTYQNRVCAFLSERLFNFWVWHRRLKVEELDWCMTEDIARPTEPHQRGRAFAGRK